MYKSSSSSSFWGPQEVRRRGPRAPPRDSWEGPQGVFLGVPLGGAPADRTTGEGHRHTTKNRLRAGLRGRDLGLAWNRLSLTRTTGSADIHTYIHTYIHAYIHTYIHTCIHAYRDTQTYIQTDRQTGRHTYIQTGRHTDRHTGRQTETYGHISR